MAKSDTEIDPPPSLTASASPWGTWEELLLASAVNRYGTTSWDSISSELRKRTSSPIYLTPHHCQQKYTELKRRFNQTESESNDLDAVNNSVTIPLLEDLRKLRVLELQRQLQNYDLYISSLQLKVKKLTEESEKKSDLGNGDEEIEAKKEPETAAVSGEVSGHVSGDGDGDGNDSEENQSVNGSNGNLEQKSENGNDDGNDNGNGNDNGGSLSLSPVRTGEEKVEALTPVREEDSCNGGPDSKNEPVKSEPGESVAESLKSEGKNSDVQSSASKSKKERIDKVRRGSTKENEDQSTDSIPVRSLPLVDFLNKLHKLGSALFERRLDTQEKLRYKNLIRQHIDYEILQTRLKEGWYSDGNDKFFRDLLLLVNNTRIFYPKESSESNAAVDLRQLILKEMMSKKKQKNELKSNEKQSSSKPANLPPKRASEPSDSLLLKPKLAGPIVVCRKRSSITAKAAGSSSGADKRKEQTELKNSEKLIEEIQDTPKRSRDGFPLMTKKKGKSVEKNPDNGKTPESSDAKSDKKKKLTEAEEKKQSAAKFLNRMKRTSNNEPLLNTLKSSSERGGGSENDSKGGGGEQKKSGGSGSKSGGGSKSGDGKKDQASKKSSGGRQVKDQGSPAKRSVGRPPKRAAAPPPMLGKHNRDSTESETLGSKQTKKRSKR